MIVLAATNQPISSISPDRAGRFDRLVYIDLPELRERREILKYLKPLKLDTDIDVDFPKQTPDFQGPTLPMYAPIGTIAARKDKNQIGKQDFLML